MKQSALQAFKRQSVSVDVNQFRMAMADAGLQTDEAILADGRLHRFHIEGHKRGSKNGAYILHDDGHPAGWFQDFRAGFTSTWCAKGKQYRLTQKQQAAIGRERAARLVEQQRQHEQASKKATSIWANATSALDEHPYLTRKAITAHGAGLSSWQAYQPLDDGTEGLVVVPDALIIPARDVRGTIWSLQAIFPDGGKRFLSGGKLRGSFFTIGEDAGGKLLICEGFATGATLHEQTGNQVFVAFSSGNLLSVAQAIRAAHPSRDIVICADNDRFTQGNPGLKAGRGAAAAINAALAAPEFPAECTSGTDFNDLAAWQCLGGIAA